MLEIFIDAFIDCLKMLPFLFVIYLLIEFLEVRYGDTLNSKIKKAGKAGPLVGAAAGILPQCGFSVMATALYSKRVVTIGTLLAVYLSTSDEAVPIILSNPGKAHLILPLIAAKFILALAAGYGIDFFYRKKMASAEEEISCTIENTDQDEFHSCCGSDAQTSTKEIILHGIIHTLKVFFYIFLVTLMLNLIIHWIGEDNLSTVFMKNSLLQPIIVSIIGLIPNCAASVAITEVFLKGGISFGSTVAGLSAGAGLGLLVLFKENRPIKDTLKVVALLVTISAVAGIIIQSIFG